MHRGGLGARRRDERRAEGSVVGELGGMAAMMREMVEGQRELVEEIRNLGELAEGIFFGGGIPLRIPKIMRSGWSRSGQRR